jgi:branched-subunit amino acid aminotransferase/4-amino-4-deoxychorismate lyase
MKKILVVFVALLAMVAFVSGVVAQEKKAEKAAAAADKPKADKPKAPKALKVTGAVAAYEAGKTITVKAKDKDMVFDIAADAKIKGEVKEGAKVTVTYKKDGDKMVATAISVAAAKKAKAPKAEKK